jgi:hypothetical protein
MIDVTAPPFSVTFTPTTVDNVQGGAIVFFDDQTYADVVAQYSVEPGGTVLLVSATPASAPLSYIGATLQIKVQGLFSVSGLVDVTSIASYSVEGGSNSVATVLPSGLVTGRGFGHATIDVAFGGMVRLVQIDVVPSPINDQPACPIQPDVPSVVCAGSTGNSASVPDLGIGAQYSWSITNGTIEAGDGTRQITFTAGASGKVVLSVATQDAAGCVSGDNRSIGIGDPLSSVVVTTAGGTTVCAAGSAGLLTATDTGGGIASHQWGYRRVSQGPITQIAGQTGAMYVISGSDLPGPGGYLLVETTSPGCGSPIVSNEVAVTETSTVAPPPPVVTVSLCPTPNITAGASLVSAAGHTYSWTVVGTSIESGQGSGSIQFDAGPPGNQISLAVTDSDPDGCVSEASTRNLQVDFADVSSGDATYPYVCALGRNRITSGCGNGSYCPGSPVTRAQMAVFLLKAKHGARFLPPSCNGVFQDVGCPYDFAVDWIEELFSEGVTGGCGTNPLLFCPGEPVTRAQMAAFLLKAEHGTGYAPPACSGVFADVPCPSLFANWIERLYAEGVTAGCSTGPLQYCPSNPNTRGQMAVFLTKTFGLQ